MARINIYVPDDLAARLRSARLAVSAVCQAALRKELDEVAPAQDLQTLSVMVGEDRHEERFRGTWLVEPSPETTRGGPNSGAYWGVAFTAKGNVAVYEAYVDDQWPPRLEVYPTLEDARLVPEIELLVNGRTTPPVWRDI